MSDGQSSFHVPPDEAAVEHALAGHEEVVSVDKPDHRFPANRWMQAVTLPK